MPKQDLQPLSALHPPKQSPRLLPWATAWMSPWNRRTCTDSGVARRGHTSNILSHGRNGSARESASLLKPDNPKGIICIKAQHYFEREAIQKKLPTALVAPDNALFVLRVKGCALHDLHATRKTNITFTEPAGTNSIMKQSASQ